MKTIRVRRSHPSPLALALALMLTMLFVYGISLSAPGGEEEVDDASALTTASAEVRMEGMDLAFLCAERADDPLQARIRAAYCSQQGGAGYILPDGEDYAVILEAVSDPEADGGIRRGTDGLTLKLRGDTGEIAALSGAVNFLWAQAAETGGLASALEGGGTDAASMRALLQVYRTQGQKVRDALEGCAPGATIVDRFREAASSALTRLDAAISDTTPSQLRLIHAAACADWIDLLEDLRARPEG